MGQQLHDLFCEPPRWKWDSFKRPFRFYSRISSPRKKFSSPAVGVHVLQAYCNFKLTRGHIGLILDWSALFLSYRLQPCDLCFSRQCFRLEPFFIWNKRSKILDGGNCLQNCLYFHTLKRMDKASKLSQKNLNMFTLYRVKQQQLFL